MKFDLVIHGMTLRKNDSSTSSIATLDKVMIRAIKGSELFYRSKKSKSVVILKKLVDQFAKKCNSKHSRTIKAFTAEVRKCFGEDLDRYRLYGNNTASLR